MAIIARGRELARRQQENRGLPVEWADDVKVDIQDLMSSGEVITIIDCRVVVTTQKERAKDGTILRADDGKPIERLKRDGTAWTRLMVFLRLEGGRWTVTSSPPMGEFLGALAALEGSALDKPGDTAAIKCMAGVRVKVIGVKQAHGGKTWLAPDLEEVEANA